MVSKGGFGGVSGENVRVWDNDESEFYEEINKYRVYFNNIDATLH